MSSELDRFMADFPSQSSQSSSQLSASSGAPSRDLSGRELGDYRLLRRLGQGAMAEVYLAEQMSLERNVAFKVLREDLAHDETYIRRLRLEAQAAAALVHANIVQVYEVGQIGDVHYISQEYVAGANLGQYLRRQGPPSVDRALQIMRQAAAALAKAGEAGIVHRDIKPDNVMLTRDGEVKVADFGLARRTSEGKNVDLTQVGVTMGTPLYMSPEQVEGRRLDARSDIYSFGVTCYHMLAGQPPFTGETSLAVAVQHLNKQPPALSGARPDLPAQLCQIVHRMLAKNPDERYQSASDVVAALDALNDVAANSARTPNGWSDGRPLQRVEAASRTTSTSLAATRELAAVMQREAKAPSRSRATLLFVTAVLAALVGGGAVARLTQNNFVLDDAGDTGQLVDRDVLFNRGMMATTPDDAEYWLSWLVEAYPDPNTYQYLYALQELIVFALERGENNRALQLSDRLVAEAPPAYPESRAFGRAGRFIALYQTGQPDDAINEFNDLLPYRDDLDDQRMIDWVDYVAQQLIDRGARSRQGNAQNHTPAPADAPPESGN
ncbi:MAG: protein kinase [Pirellulales bacterium]